MIPAPPHPRETQRLRTARALLALPRGAEPVLDTLTSLACRLLDLPVALITVVDDELLHALSAAGTDVATLPLHEAMCPWAVATDDVLVVPDLLLDLRFHDGAVVEQGMRSYHGVPLRGTDGLPLGALCVLDTAPRVLDADERLVLEELAEVAASHLELLLRRGAETADGAAARAALRHADGDPADTEHDLAAGLAGGQVIPFFQPIMSLTDDRIVGVEALARWEHPFRGVLAPAEFLAAAEEGDLVVRLDATVLEEACHQVQVWRRTRPEVAGLQLSVNVSGRHLAGTDLVGLVEGALRRSGLPASALTLELTETALVEAGGSDQDGRSDSVAEVLRGLRALGVGLALDDFGTAYSTLTYLQRFPVSRVKVDRSFVAGLATQQRDVLLVESVVTLAQRLGMDVVAEGVETLEQLDVLRDLGCDKGQGYLFQRPLGAEDLERSGMLGDAAPGEVVLFPGIDLTAVRAV